MAAILARGQHLREIAGDERDLGVRLGGVAGLIVAVRRRLAAGVGEQALRVERRNLGGQLAGVEREVAGNPDIGRTRMTSRLPARVTVETRMT